MRWEDVYDIKSSKNVRGENVYDIYKKGTDEMIWADVPVDQIDDFLKRAVGVSERIATEELDKLFTEEPTKEKPKDNKPMVIEYDRLRKFGHFGCAIFEEDEEK